MKFTENQMALFLVAVLAAALMIRAVPGPNGAIVAALAGGLLGFLKGGGSPQPPQP